MKLALVCSQGGHLTQMTLLLPAFEGHRHFFVTHRCTRTELLARSCHAYLLPEIGTNLVKMVKAFAWAFWILAKERPDVVVTTGSEIGIPFCWVGKLLGARIVYIETWARVNTQSGTGRLVYPVADLFLVQWPELLRLYGPRARCVGGVI